MAPALLRRNFFRNALRLTTAHIGHSGRLITGSTQAPYWHELTTANLAEHLRQSGVL